VPSLLLDTEHTEAEVAPLITPVRSCLQFEYSVHLLVDHSAASKAMRTCRFKHSHFDPLRASRAVRSDSWPYLVGEEERHRQVGGRPVRAAQSGQHLLYEQCATSAEVSAISPCIA